MRSGYMVSCGAGSEELPVMADDFNILIRNCSEIERVVEATSRFIGHPLVKRTDVEWELYETHTVGLFVNIYEADWFENSDGIKFEKYQLTVGMHPLRMVARLDHFDEWFRLFAVMLADFLSQELSCECLVVMNLCRIIAAFPAAAPE